MIIKPACSPGCARGVIIGLAIEGTFLLAAWGIYLCFFFRTPQ